MRELQVEIVRLAPMQVASFYGFGHEPEFQAAAKMLAWAEARLDCTTKASATAYSALTTPPRPQRARTTATSSGSN